MLFPLDLLEHLINEERITVALLLSSQSDVTGTAVPDLLVKSSEFSFA